MQIPDVAFINAIVIGFWLMPWSQAFRSACRWFTPETRPARGRVRPDKDAPRWLRPLFLQRWVGEAIAQRLQTHPQTTSAYRYGRESEPCWDAVAWTPTFRTSTCSIHSIFRREGQAAPG